MRINDSLLARGYLTWYDLANMKGKHVVFFPFPVCLLMSEGNVRSGSIVESMSEAIEGADVMLYGCSHRYKESANVCVALQRVFNFLKAPPLCLDCLIAFICSGRASVALRRITHINKISR